MDLDGDGVPRANAVAWDAFPLDPKEWRDSDGDGIGDNGDPDDDGDGFSDEAETKAGTDPLDRMSFPLSRAAGIQAPATLLSRGQPVQSAAGGPRRRAHSP